MRSMFSYRKAAVERAMKVQEVILRAMAKRITWWQAAEIIGISDRQMRRWRERYEEFGYDGLFDRRQGKPSPKRVPVALVEQVLGLYRDRYFDLNVRHFHEKQQSEHEIELSYTWVKLALQGAGLVTRGRKRGVHRKRRPRRPLPGMLLHIDGSHHRWFQDERWYDLIVILDDATSEIYYAQLVEEESTVTVIPAYSPQARGRSERNFGTWQGRLPQELRLHGIDRLEEANRFLREHYMAEFNRQFQVRAAERGTAFLPRRGQNLDLIFSLQFERAVNRDNTVSFQHLSLQIEPVRWRATLAGCTVRVHQHLDGTLTITHGPQRLGRYSAEGELLLHTMAASRVVEKPRAGKVPKPTFPPRLEIPQNARDSHFPTTSATAG